MHDERLLTPAQVAERVQVAPLTVMGWLRKGNLKGVKAGRFWRIRESDLEAFLKADVEDDPLAAINEALKGTDRQ